MTLDSTAVLVPDSGNFFIAPYVDATPAALPANLAAISSPFEAIGHTSLENIFTPTSEGGDATTLGTLQNKNLRTTYSPRSETFNIVLQQFDAKGLKLYYGSNSTVGTDGELWVPDGTPTPTIVTFLGVFYDGEKAFAYYAPKAEILRSDDADFGDAESLAGLPLGIKPIKHPDFDGPFAVTPLGQV